MKFAYRNVYKFRCRMRRKGSQWSALKHAHVVAGFDRIGYEILAVDPTGRTAPVVVVFVSTEGKP